MQLLSALQPTSTERAMDIKNDIEMAVEHSEGGIAKEINEAYNTLQSECVDGAVLNEKPEFESNHIEARIKMKSDDWQSERPSKRAKLDNDENKLCEPNEEDNQESANLKDLTASKSSAETKNDVNKSNEQPLLVSNGTDVTTENLEEEHETKNCTHNNLAPDLNTLTEVEKNTSDTDVSSKTTADKSVEDEAIKNVDDIENNSELKHRNHSTASENGSCDAEEYHEKIPINELVENGSDFSESNDNDGVVNSIRKSTEDSTDSHSVEKESPKFQRSTSETDVADNAQDNEKEEKNATSLAATEHSSDIELKNDEENMKDILETNHENIVSVLSSNAASETITADTDIKNAHSVIEEATPLTENDNLSEELLISHSNPNEEITQDSDKSKVTNDNEAEDSYSDDTKQIPEKVVDTENTCDLQETMTKVSEKFEKNDNKGEATPENFKEPPAQGTESSKPNTEKEVIPNSDVLNIGDEPEKQTNKKDDASPPNDTDRLEGREETETTCELQNTPTKGLELCDKIDQSKFTSKNIDQFSEKVNELFELDAHNDVILPSDDKKSGIASTNKLNIISDDDDVTMGEASNNSKLVVDLVDDDDIMLVDDKKDGSENVLVSKNTVPVVENKEDSTIKPTEPTASILGNIEESKIKNVVEKTCEAKNVSQDMITESLTENIKANNKKNAAHEELTKKETFVKGKADPSSEKDVPTLETITKKKLLAKDFMARMRSKLTDMTREDLEDFCLLTIVEGVMEKSGLTDLATKVHNLEQNVETWRKKAMFLSKQNKDLTIVLRTVQDEQRLRLKEVVQPLKITRSVGLQVLMLDNSKNANIAPLQQHVMVPPKQTKPRNSTPSASSKKDVVKAHTKTPPVAKAKQNPSPIPVPRLVPANQNNSPAKVSTVQSEPKPSDKRSVCIDLTDDEPAAKKPNVVQNQPPNVNRFTAPHAVRNPTIPVRVSAQAQFPNRQPGPQSFKPPTSIPGSPGSPFRVRPGPIVRSPAIRPPAQRPLKHPAPLPVTPRFNMTGVKPLPPAPELKITRVENGIVISWTMDDYSTSKFEEIASYQLYAYQETSAAPSTMLWKKIGDVKALPLPMACTLTQFMAGFKYYFAVRAVDIKSRLGPFSLPGSILLLLK